MAFSTTQSTSTYSTDSGVQKLEAEKAKIFADIGVLGQEIERLQNLQSSLDDVSAEVELVKVDLEVLEKARLTLLSDIKVIEMQKDVILREVSGLESKRTELRGIEASIGSKRSEFDSLLSSEGTKLRDIKLSVDTLRAEEKRLTLAIDKLSEDKSAAESEIESLRTDIGKLNASITTATRELGIVQGKITDAHIQLSAVNSNVVSARNELYDLHQKRDEELANIASDRKTFEDECKNREAQLDARQVALEEREGVNSKRSEMLDGRAQYLNTAKARLEHYLGKSLDLIIE